MNLSDDEQLVLRALRLNGGLTVYKDIIDYFLVGNQLTRESYKRLNGALEELIIKGRIKSHVVNWPRGYFAFELSILDEMASL